MKKMDHNQYPKLLRKLPEASLRYIIKDAKEAIEAYPENPNCGYYQDEINYCCNELHRRRKG